MRAGFTPDQIGEFTFAQIRNFHLKGKTAARRNRRLANLRALELLRSGAYD